MIGLPTKQELYFLDEPLILTEETFTRSNGTIVARIYERLTKASRREAQKYMTEGGDLYGPTQAEAYRQGVYDAFRALQEELA